ncbi:MAG TPA: ROK family protein [Armatimonadota bacterium]|nr:ROK family protein [Armatimonadota bacterium]
MIRLENSSADNPDAANAAIGVDIGGTNHTAALVNSAGEAIEILRGHTDRSGGPRALLESLSRLLPELMTEARERDVTVTGLGAGFGGPVDFAAGRVLLSHHVSGWDDFPLRDELTAMSGLPVTLDNDANAGGLGEARFGAGQGASDVVYYNIGTGIGGAIILGGQLRRGPGSIAGELGHVTIFPDGPLCTCGQRGCLEAVASGSAIARRISELALEWEGRPALAEDFFPLVAAGHPAAMALRDEIARSLAIAIRNILHTLNPEVVIIGGGVSRGGALLLDPVREAVHNLAFPAAYRTCRIVLARLGYEAGVIGAAALAMS